MNNVFASFKNKTYCNILAFGALQPFTNINHDYRLFFFYKLLFNFVTRVLIFLSVAFTLSLPFFLLDYPLSFFLLFLCIGFYWFGDDDEAASSGANYVDHLSDRRDLLSLHFMQNIEEHGHWIDDGRVLQFLSPANGANVAMFVPGVDGIPPLDPMKRW